ncbi:hypothetical protein [Kocuria atrinae]|uniref:HoxN/HupN/NixA family nickel/cobalt transporter n=1 Tax=Kocuria atrinae TaxID=592377 RepID=UPI0002ECA613|nr:hypothetical protein [Kocuria atrinae]
MSSLSTLNPAVGRPSVDDWPFRTRVLCTLGAVALLHLVALGLWGLGSLGGSVPLAIGLVITCYLTGVKHSYDWDHIAAIDNSTRRFVGQGKRPASVGLAFSMGHSSVVILAGILVVLGRRSCPRSFPRGPRRTRLWGSSAARCPGCSCC